MKNRKNILKDAIILLVATIFISTSIVIVPNTFAQIPNHDVGIESIDSPISGCAEEFMPVIVTVKNYGNCTEITNVQVTIIKSGMTIPEYDETMTNIYVPYNSQVVVQFGPPDAINFWTPSDWPSSCLEVSYSITACTLLVDEDNSNDCITNDITLDFDTEEPTTTRIFTPAVPDGLNGWYVHCINVKLQAIDSCTGISSIYYRLDGGTWNGYTTAPFNVCDCKHTLDYYSIDECGNEESKKGPFELKIDTVPPTSTINIQRLRIFFTRFCIIRIRVTASDLCSGVWKVDFYRNSVPHHSDTSPPYIWWTFGICSNSYSAVVYDMAGNHNP